MTDFIGIADLATFMRVDSASLDTALANLSVQAAQSVVRNYLGQELTLHVDDVAYLDGTGKPWIRLPERPVISVASVTLDGDTVGPTEYLLRRSLLIRTDRGSWTIGNVNVVVTYTHGYQTAVLDSDTSDSDFDVNHIPPDISLVALILARRSYERSISGEQGTIKSETIGTYSYTLADQAGVSEMTDAERSVLDAYLVKGYG